MNETCYSAQTTMKGDKLNEMRRRGSIKATTGSGSLIVWESGDITVTVNEGDFGGEREMIESARKLASRRLVPFSEWKKDLFAREDAFVKGFGGPSPATHVFDPLEWMRNTPGGTYDELRAATEAAREAGFEVLEDSPSWEGWR